MLAKPVRDITNCMPYITVIVYYRQCELNKYAGSSVSNVKKCIVRISSGIKLFLIKSVLKSDSN